jgi:hypothetical protein
LDTEASSGSAIALVASGGQQQRPSPTPVQQCRPPSSPAPFGGPQPLTPPNTGSGGGGGSSGGGGGGSGHRRCNRSGGSGEGGGGGTGDTTTPTTGQGRGGTPWPSFYNPWTDTINMWLGPSRPTARSRPPHAFFVALSVGPPFNPLAALPLPRAPPPQ